MSDALYDAVAFGMRYWFLVLIALMLFTLIFVSVAEYKRHKSIMNAVGSYIGYLETSPSGNKPPERFGIMGGTVIGSGKRSDIIIENAGVARTHATILYRHGKAGIMPAKGADVTVNGALFDKPFRIYTGDKLKIGTVTLEVHLKEANKVDT